MGLCFLGTTIYNPQEIIETLHLPKLVMPVATITLGYPAEEGKVSERLPIEAIVHRETYDDYSDERINILYKEKEELPDNVHFVEINNKKTLAQVFADIRYTKKDCESISGKLLQALRQQGFLKE